MNRLLCLLALACALCAPSCTSRVQLERAGPAPRLVQVPSEHPIAALIRYLEKQSQGLDTFEFSEPPQPHFRFPDQTLYDWDGFVIKVAQNVGGPSGIWGGSPAAYHLNGRVRSFGLAHPEVIEWTTLPASRYVELRSDYQDGATMLECAQKLAGWYPQHKGR